MCIFLSSAALSEEGSSQPTSAIGSAGFYFDNYFRILAFTNAIVIFEATSGC